MPDGNRENLELQLSAYLDGELSDSERAEVERVLAADPAARETLASLRRTIELTRQLPRRKAPETLIDDVTARIEREQLLGDPRRVLEAAPRRRSIWPMLASAAVVVFAVGGGLWVFRALSPAKHAAVVAVRTEESSRAAPEPRSAPEYASLKKSESSAGSFTPPPAPRLKDEDPLNQPQLGKDLAKRSDVVQPAPSAEEPPLVGEKLGITALAEADWRENAQTAPGSAVGASGMDASAAPVEADTLVLNVTFENQADLAQFRNRLYSFGQSNRMAMLQIAETAPTMSEAAGAIELKAGHTPEMKVERLLIEAPAGQFDDLMDQLSEPGPPARGMRFEQRDELLVSAARRVDRPQRQILAPEGYSAAVTSEAAASRPADDGCYARARELASAPKVTARSSTINEASASQPYSVSGPAVQIAPTHEAETSTAPADERHADLSDQNQSRADAAAKRRSGGPMSQPVEGGHRASLDGIEKARPGVVGVDGEDVVRLVVNFFAPADAPAESTSRPATTHPATTAPTGSP